MKLHLKYTAQLRTVLQRAEDHLDLPEPKSLGELLEHVAQQNPDARPHLFNAAGEVNSSLLMVVNDVAVPATDVSSVALRDGDAVLLLPPIAGG
jgi:molybdopterin converting factor small subunit